MMSGHFVYVRLISKFNGLSECDSELHSKVEGVIAAGGETTFRVPSEVH